MNMLRVYRVYLKDFGSVLIDTPSEVSSDENGLAFRDAFGQIIASFSSGYVMGYVAAPTSTTPDEAVTTVGPK